MFLLYLAEEGLTVTTKLLDPCLLMIWFYHTKLMSHVPAVALSRQCISSPFGPVSEHTPHQLSEIIKLDVSSEQVLFISL